MPLPVAAWAIGTALTLSWASPQAETEDGSPTVAAAPPRAGVRASVDEGFWIDSADRRFSLGFGFFAQGRHTTQIGEDPSRGFQLTRIRPVTQARLWDGLVALFMQPELAGSASLLDADVVLDIHPAFKLDLGQFRPYASRGFRIGLPFTTIIDRGPVNDAFRVDRDLGITVFGLPFDGRLEYYFGAFNGDGRNVVRNGDGQMLYTARVVAAPLGAMPYSQTRYLGAERDLRLAIGLNGYTNIRPDTEDVVDPLTGETTTLELTDQRIVGASADFAASVSIVGIEAEGFWRRGYRPDRADTLAWGTYGAVSVLAIPKRLDVGMRVGAMRRESDPDPFMPLEPGLGLYLYENHAKLQFRYTCDVVPGDSTCQRHEMTGQLNLMF